MLLLLLAACGGQTMDGVTTADDRPPAVDETMAGGATTDDGRQTTDDGAPATDRPPTAVATVVVSTSDAPTPGVPTEGPPTPDAPPPTVAPSGPVAGRNPDGTYFYGAVDAPLALIDYSDFL